MKRLTPILGFTLTVLLSGEMGARDLSTTTGETFQQIELLKTEPTGLRIMHQDGVAFVDFALLPAETQAEFGFDPAAYEAGQAANLEAARRRAEAYAAAQAARIAAREAAARAARAEAPPDFAGPAPAPFTTENAAMSLHREGGGSGDTSMLPQTVVVANSMPFSVSASRPLINHNRSAASLLSTPHGVSGTMHGLSGASGGFFSAGMSMRR